MTEQMEIDPYAPPRAMIAEPSVPGYAMALAGDGGIDGGVGTLPGPPRSHVTVYVDSDDPAADLERVESLGGTTVLPATEIPGGPTIALFADPEGHVVGLAKRPAR